jgi:hypothetical protein
VVDLIIEVIVQINVDLLEVRHHWQFFSVSFCNKFALIVTHDNQWLGRIFILYNLGLGKNGRPYFKESWVAPESDRLVDGVVEHGVAEDVDHVVDFVVSQLVLQR